MSYPFQNSPLKIYEKKWREINVHQACALHMHYARGKYVVINEKKMVLVLDFFSFNKNLIVFFFRRKNLIVIIRDE